LTLQGPLVSVVVCSRDRAAQLDRALESLAVCTVPDDLHWEVIVIDNGSDDAATIVVESYLDRLPIRAVREPVPGLSQARNRGVEEARGDWLLWIDDDVSVDREWLTAYVRAIEAHSDFSVLGGRILPELEGSPADWLIAGMRWVGDAYAARVSEDLRGDIGNFGEKPYGANFATCRAAAREYRYRDELGRHPLRPTGGGEETDVIRRILAGGGRGRWVPDAIVVHHIDRDRQSVGYLRAYFSDAGGLAAVAWRRRHLFERVRLLSHSIGRWTAHGLAYHAGRLCGYDTRRAKDLKEAAWHRGYVRACASQVLRSGRIRE